MKSHYLGSRSCRLSHFLVTQHTVGCLPCTTLVPWKVLKSGGKHIHVALTLWVVLSFPSCCDVCSLSVFLPEAVPKLIFKKWKEFPKQGHDTLLKIVFFRNLQPRNKR